MSKNKSIDQECKRPPGRPRCERARHAILSSTLKFLEVKGNGFDDLAIEHIAAEAGVGKATVYRWWPNKAALVADAFTNSVNPKLHFPDTGSVAGDLSQQMQQLVRILRSRRGQILSTILGAGQSDSGLIYAFRERFLKPRRAEAYETLRRGIQRGELPPELDMDLMLDALYGAIIFRFLVGHERLTPDFVQELCALVLHNGSQKAQKQPRRNGDGSRARGMSRASGQV